MGYLMLLLQGNRKHTVVFNHILYKAHQYVWKVLCSCSCSGSWLSQKTLDDATLHEGSSGNVRGTSSIII